MDGRSLKNPRLPDGVEIFERKSVHDGYAQVCEYRLRHRLYDGGWSGEIKRELVERGNAVAVLPYDPRRDRIVLVEQFRIGACAAGLPPWQREIPAGMVEDGESEDEVARRETREECGCEVRKLHRICRVLSSSGILSEIVAVYCGVVDASEAGKACGLAGEDIRVTTLAAEDALRLDASFHYAPGIIAIQWLAANRARLRKGCD